MKLSVRLGLLACLVLSVPVFAIEEAGRLERRFDKPPEPLSSPKPLLFPLEEKLPPAQAEQIRFTLKQINIQGATAIPVENLRELYAGQLGKEVSLLDIYRIRDAITALYGQEGYALSRALIPKQQIESDGIVQMQVLEGFIDEIVIDGGTEAQRDYLIETGEAVKAERPLNAKTLERYLLFANDRFAMRVTSTLKVSDKTPGASTLILKVEPAPLLQGGTTFDNRGSNAIGPWQTNAQLTLNGLFGLASQTTLGYASTLEDAAELQYGSAAHTAALGRYGTTVSLGWIGTRSKPGTDLLRRLDIESQSDFWFIRFNQPILRTRQQNLVAHFGFDYRDTSTNTLGQLTGSDRLRTFRFGLSYDTADRFNGVNQAIMEYSHGINGLGASDYRSPRKSRADGKPDYDKLNLRLSRLQPFGYFDSRLNAFSAYLALMGQYSGDGLMSPEECGLGGEQFGRAYNYSELLGDSCIAGSLELRYQPDFRLGPLNLAQVFVFYDGGYVSNHAPLSVGGATSESLSSTGIGLRYAITNFVSGNVEVTKPLTRDVAQDGNKDVRVFTSISARF